jgi:hypothetical protein
MTPTFMYGPKDGSPVPEPLWALDVIELAHRISAQQTIIYYYELNTQDKNWYFKGQVEEENNE